MKGRKPIPEETRKEDAQKESLIRSLLPDPRFRIIIQKKKKGSKINDFENVGLHMIKCRTPKDRKKVMQEESWYFPFGMVIC